MNGADEISFNFTVPGLEALFSLIVVFINCKGSIIFALINTPESAIGYIIVFCIAITLFWLFDTPETTEKKSIDKIDRKAINIDVPIESETTGINLKK